MMWFSQSGTVFDPKAMNREILGMERKCAIHLPLTTRPLREVIRFCDCGMGAGDEQSGWVQKGQVKHITDKVIA